MLGSDKSCRNCGGEK